LPAPKSSLKMSAILLFDPLRVKHPRDRVVDA
jgi:hypothetical protein